VGKLLWEISCEKVEICLAETVVNCGFLIEMSVMLLKCLSSVYSCRWLDFDMQIIIFKIFYIYINKY
jgi:hypothetical protein